MARELTYLDFDVLMERGDQDTYRARVVNAPAGQTPPIAFTMPFTPQELEIFVLRIGQRRRVVRRVDAPATAAIKTFGGQLYRALFHDQLEVNLLRSLSEADAKGAGLRIRLRLSDTPELGELPWEFLYDPTRNRFLCLSDRTPLVRFLEVSDPPRPLTVSPPLQVLVMIASPSDYPQLDVEQEWTKLVTALAPLEQASQVQVTRLETASLGALRQRLRQADWHVLHFIGHGGFDPQTQDGVLVLEDQTGRSRLVSGQDLGVLLHDHHPLRLVVLNACEGARADPSDPFAGTAQGLIQQGIPAVVAMQFEITDPAAISFASELYAAVADSYPLDAALAEARKAIWADGNQVEWATPVLYLRAPDGRIFEVAPPPPHAIPAPFPATGVAAPEAGSTRKKPAKSKPRQSASSARPEARPIVPPGKPVASPQATTSKSAPAATGKVPPTAGNRRQTIELSISEGYTFRHRSRWLVGTEGVRGVAFSPDGRWLATACDRIARIWDTHSGQELRTFTHNDAVGKVAFGPDGRWLATSSNDSTARIWDTHSGQELRTFTHNDGVQEVAFSPDGRRLATASFDTTARIWDTHSGQELHTLTHDSPVAAVAFGPDGRRLATGSADSTARIWDTHSGQELHALTHHDEVEAVAFGPDGRRLATGTRAEDPWGAQIWDAQSGEQLDALAYDASVWALAFSPDGRWLAFGGSDSTVQIWDTHSGARHTLTHDNDVFAVAFSPDGRWLATGTFGNWAMLWSLSPST